MAVKKALETNGRKSKILGFGVGSHDGVEYCSRTVDGGPSQECRMPERRFSNSRYEIPKSFSDQPFGVVSSDLQRYVPLPARSFVNRTVDAVSGGAGL